MVTVGWRLVPRCPGEMAEGAGLTSRPLAPRLGPPHWPPCSAADEQGCPPRPTGSMHRYPTAVHHPPVWPQCPAVPRQSRCTTDLCSAIDDQHLSDGRMMGEDLSDQAGPERHRGWRRRHHSWTDGQSSSATPQGCPGAGQGQPAPVEKQPQQLQRFSDPCYLGKTVKSLSLPL